MEFIILDVKRGKKRKALDVVPVVMGDKNVCARRAAGVGWGPAIAKHAKAGSAIEDELISIGSNEFEAWGITAIAPSSRVHGGRGTAYTPKS